MKKMKILFFFCLLCIVASIRSVAQEVKPDEATGEQIYILKDGYTLILTDVLEQGNHVYKVFLKKGNEIFLVSSGQYFNNEKYFPRYEGIDFNDCFVLAFFMGDYNYVLYDKDTHVPVLDFYLGGYDISNNRYWIFIWADMIYQIICLFIGKKKAVYRGTLPLHGYSCLSQPVVLQQNTGRIRSCA